MINKPNEKGQALIVVALAAMVLFGFAALAIDGSMAFSDRRHAQNAADTAALAGALAFTRGNDVLTSATGRATDNDYTTTSNATKLVEVFIHDVPTGACPGKAPGKDIEVKITSVVNTTFARILGRTHFTNVVSATARGCGYIVSPLFPGNAIVGLDHLYTQNGNHLAGCGFDTGGNGTRKILGGGVFFHGGSSNTCISSGHLDPCQCVTNVGPPPRVNCSSQK